MLYFFKEQFDFSLFLCVISFLALAATCLTLPKKDRLHSRWILLFLFAVFFAGKDLFSLFYLAFEQGRSHELVRAVLCLVSLVFLTEFGRSGITYIRGVRKTVAFYALAAFIVLLTTLAYGIKGFNISTRLVFGLFGGLCAAYTVLLSSSHRTETHRWWNRAGAAAMTGLSITLIPAHFYPDELIISVDNYLLSNGFPIEIIRAFFGFILIATITFSSRQKEHGLFPSNGHQSDLAGTIAFTSTITILIIFGGWCLTEYLGKRGIDELRRNKGATVELLLNGIMKDQQEVESFAKALSADPLLRAFSRTPDQAKTYSIRSALNQYIKAFGMTAAFIFDKNGAVLVSTSGDALKGSLPAVRANNGLVKRALVGTMGYSFILDPPSYDRGYFVSIPLVTGQNTVAGILVVAKKSDHLELTFRNYRNAFLVDPNGIIYLSSQPDMILQRLWPLDASTYTKIVESRQFGTELLETIFLKEITDGDIVTLNREQFYVTRSVFPKDNWSVVLLSPTSQVRTYRLLGIAISLGLYVLFLGLSVWTKHARDFTMQIIDSENRFRAIFESAPDAILIYDEASGKILTANAFMLHWLGYGKNEMQRMKRADFIEASHDTAGEHRYKKKDDTTIIVEETQRKLSYRGRNVVLTIARDVTERKRAEELLITLSHNDGLTGLTNRRKFNDCLEHELKRAHRGGTPLSLILCDIDYFKDYNDTYGHIRGDECLVTVARALQKSVQRPADTVARYGGEEFAIILPDTDRNGAIKIAEKLRARVEKLNITHKSSKICDHVTISLGIATIIPDNTVMKETLLTRADEALYGAKKNGRNRSEAC